jgi:sporulation protein YlmC with PRC-barrel domain
LRLQREQRARESLAALKLEGSLISLAALLGTEVKDSAGAPVGQLRDAVVRWTKGRSYPAVTAIVVRTGRRDVLVGARWVEFSAPSSVRLRSSAVYARAIKRHPADVALAHDVLDRQIVDAAGVQIVRPADLYLSVLDGRIDLVGIEIGVLAPLRRLGPKRLRSRFRPERVIDWTSIRSFSPARADGVWSPGRRSDLAGQAGSGLRAGPSRGRVTATSGK